MCETGCLAGYAANLVPRTVSSDPNPRTFWNRLDGYPHGGTIPCVLVYLAKFKSIDYWPLTVIQDCLIDWP
jgi:hypothetical protein